MQKQMRFFVFALACAEFKGMRAFYPTRSRTLIAICDGVRQPSTRFRLILAKNPFRHAVGTFLQKLLCGIGSLYYFAYALHKTDFPHAKELWAVVILILVISVIVHGLSAKPAMETLDRHAQRKNATKRT